MHTYEVIKNLWTFPKTFDPKTQSLSTFGTATCFLLQLCLQSFIVLSLTVKKLQMKEENAHLLSWNSPLTFMTSQQILMGTTQSTFRIAAFDNALKMILSIKYGFLLSILIALLEG